MYKHINIEEVTHIIQITKAICDTISKYSIECNNLMFDMSLTTIISSCNYNADIKKPIDNYYGYSVKVTKNLIYQYFPEKRNDIKAEDEYEEKY